jgi:hypothetical protein
MSVDSPPRRATIGRFVEQAGRLGLPLGVGLVAGFWAADLGVAWLPTMLEIVLALAIAALVAIVIGAWLAGRALAPTAEGRRLRRRTVATLALVALACNLGSNPDAGAQVTATSAGAVAGPGTLVALSDVPEVVIQSPADGSEALLYNELQVYATAADKQGVTRIELRVDNLLVDTSASPNPQGSPTLSTS